ncbi:MAG: hypothetical protein N2Z84_02520 [Atribacterota bacterium]|nr:hypothetical protein [Atribacterota bacterium]
MAFPLEVCYNENMQLIRSSRRKDRPFEFFAYRRVSQTERR